MNRRATGWTCLGVAVPAAFFAAALAPASSAGGDQRPAGSDLQTVVARINRHIADKWKEHGVTPAPRTNDAEFLRRVYLDLAGRIPSITEVRDFLDDESPDKRGEIVNRLLDPPRNNDPLKDLYVNHFANFWRSGLMPETNDPTLRFNGNTFENWLRTQVRANVGYDRIARAVLTYTPSGGNQGIQAFYQANENRAENLAAATSRFFLGNKLECAQCHNHPFARISREQFWEYAAFFAGVGRGGAAPEIAIPETDKRVAARFLDGTAPSWKSGEDPRVLLADWMVAPANPYFARTAVNRLWAYFFGLGLHEPVDEPWAGSPTHPELLDELAREFAAQQFDVKFLIRAIVASDAYQLSSKRTHPSQDDPRWLGKMSVRGLTPEQLFDSLAEATGYKETAGGNPRFDGFGRPINPRSEFIALFASHDRKIEAQTSILQALHLMNGKFMQDAVNLKKNDTLATIAEAKNATTARRISDLYMITLSRRPTEAELHRLVKYVDAGGADNDYHKALADVFWALLNSSEFALNH